MSIKAVVLFSGGQDSTTCLAQACADFPGEVLAVGFDYGQRHLIELEQAQKIAKIADVRYRILDMTFMAQLSPNSLTNHMLPIEHHEGELPSTFVPGRNLFFLSAAAIVARQVGAAVIYTGVCQTDFSGYPDCRDDFVRSAEKTINLALESRLKIKTPLMFLTKAETVELMRALKRLDWYRESHTCYEGQRPSCGGCPACLLRKKGFFEAGIPDPLTGDD